MMQARNSCLYIGRIMHQRMIPKRHRFTYSAFAMLLDLDELEGLDRTSRLFSHNRPGIMSFHDRDHGPCDGSSLRNWAELHLHEAGINVSGGAIRILCLPRMFGYVFNPISVWFCHDQDGALAAMIYEVRNTFGERRSYLMAVDTAQRDSGFVRQDCAKAFHVSPFLPVEGNYHFRLAVPDERMMLQIRHEIEGETRLIAVQCGTRHSFSPISLVRVLARFPLMTFKVFAAIRFEALRLWIKGVPVHGHVRASTPEVLSAKGPATP